MFTVYHSNQLDLLKTLAATLIESQPLRNPFQPELILVQSNGMAQWMKIELAAHFGIAANIEFPLPASFIWKMFTCVLCDIPEESAFSKQAMTWRLMALLPDLCQKPNFSAIKKYLDDDDDQRKSFQFSAKIADLFDQYLVYRPDWLISWQNGKFIQGLSEAQYWQALLWKTLMSETARTGQSLWHRANLHERFIHTLAQSQVRPSGLPDRIFICGISALSPTYLEALQALGRHIDIHLLFTNPCRYYWGDICDRTFLSRLLHRRRLHYEKQTEQALFRYPDQANTLFDEVGQQQIGNPLLASWGKQGRDNLYLLAQIDGMAEVDAFLEPSDNHLLSVIQRDILALEDYSMISMSEKNHYQDNTISRRLLRLDDRSLSLHICHSPQREVEVLHDSLLTMMSEDPTLQPRDIMVMVADIERYTPAIQAVFGNTVSNNRYLPFSISDMRARHSHPVYSAFLTLLELPYSRFRSEEILALLEIPALAARFGIKETELDLLRKWVVESGIRWGLDDETLQELMLPVTGQHTWQFGLTRMMLGYAMDTKHGDWQGILPYEDASGLIANLIGQLAEFLMRLRYWRDWLSKSYSLETWLNCARKIIQDFFLPDPNTESALIFLENQWNLVLKYGMQIGYHQPVSVVWLKDQLVSQLDQERLSPRFLVGNINFCTLMPMRSIPFRIICLLGMNDGIYPRTLQPSGLDLMAQKPRRGDRSRRDDDHYLFLEALLSARDRLYISFIGRDIKNNAIRYPSTLVSELSNYITQSFYLSGDQHTNHETSTNRVHKHLWQMHSRTPFSPENFLPGETQSFASEWLPAARKKGVPQPDFMASLTLVHYNTLTLDTLLRFYYHPVRSWFVHRLGVSFDQLPPKLTSYEPFIINSLTRYQINNYVVNSLISGKNTDQLFRQVRSSGLLPYGAFGELYWMRQCKQMTVLSEQVRSWKLPHTQSIKVDIALNDVILSGWLSQVQENGLLRWKPRPLSIRDGLLLWLEHLVYCLMGGQGESRMFGTQGQWHFSQLLPSVAKAFLRSLVSGYYEGMTSPLLLLARSGGAWLSYSYDRKTNNINREARCQYQARKKVLEAWQGNNYVTGENKDFYLKRLIRELDEKHINLIILAAEQYFLSPLMFNKST